MTLGFILLGLLSLEPMTGYDLKAFFSKSVNFFWSAELSQIYRELGKLEKQGFIRYEIVPQEGRPDRKVYNITDSGEAAFMNWLIDFPPNLTPISRNEFLVRIFFSAKLPKEELVLQLSKYIRQQEADLRIYRQIQERLDSLITDGKPEELFHQRLTVKRGIHFANAEISWARECIEDIKGVQV